LIQLAVTIIAMVIGGTVTWLALAQWLGAVPPLLYIPLVAVEAAVATAATGALIGYHLYRRMAYLNTLAEAWLRGNLALRASDPNRDEIGAIARRLDQIIEHLEEDEQDLARLRESNARLTDQVRALAVVEERNRLARELHDTVKQHLFSLAMTASAVRMQLETDPAVESAARSPDPEDADRASLRQMTREIETEARAAQRETTRLIEDLKPASLQQLGLADALNDYTLLFGAQEHLLVYLDVECADRHLPLPTAEALYRVAQEALHNVARHARATRVDVHLHGAEHRVRLTVEDNGIGFDVRQARRGLGLDNMQERLMAVGGRLSVESQPGVGTTIIAEVDVTPPVALTQTSEARQPVRPRTESWAWLGQRLMIPVGQVWPWLPVDQANYLRDPQLEPGVLRCREEARWLGMFHRYTLWAGEAQTPAVHITPDRSGAHWRHGNGAHWALRHVRGLKGRAILERNEQPLAAMQYQGRELNTWTAIIYDDVMYRLAYEPDGTGGFTLTDELDDLVLNTGGAEIHLHRALPLPLVAMVVARMIDESAMRRIGTLSDKQAQGFAPLDTPGIGDREVRIKLERELRTVVRDAAGEVPADILDRLQALERTLLDLLPRIDNLNSSDIDTYTVRQTIRDYLPAALSGYRALPAGFAEDEPIQEGKTAHEHLHRQLDLLQQAIDDIADRIPREKAQRLLSHGRFLAGKFTQPGKGQPALKEEESGEG
jgi:signal transduction histidine kinase